MMVDVTYQMVLSTLQTAGILAGIAYYLFMMRRLREERRNQYANEVGNISFSQEYSENWISFLRNMEFSTYEEWGEKYGPYVNPDAAIRYFSLISYYNSLGTRIMKGQIDADSVTEYMMAFHPLLVWEKSITIFEEWRKRYNNPKMMNGFEYLVTEIKKIHPNLTSTPNPQRQRLMKR